MRSLISLSTHNPDFERLLPLQIYGEFHLAQDSSIDNDATYQASGTAYVWNRLRHYFDNMFIRGGYIPMYVGTTAQTRNTDMLLVKVFCHKSNRGHHHSYHTNITEQTHNHNSSDTSHVIHPNSEYTLRGNLRRDFHDLILEGDIGVGTALDTIDAEGHIIRKAATSTSSGASGNLRVGGLPNSLYHRPIDIVRNRGGGK